MSDSLPVSPCVNLCTLDRAGICIGCFRSIEDIARWTSMSAAEKWRAIEAAERRRRVHVSARGVANN